MTERPSIRVALAQLNPTVGDVAGNCDLIAAAYEDALEADADLVVTPELSLVGYPPRDLLHRGALLDACEEALSDLATRTTDPRWSSERPTGSGGRVAHSETSPRSVPAAG